ncbi:MAG: SUF system NifU family Fe-S cluster assembly protein [Firmicutes bacterium]|nr:SUF system NifU family Fe-S cluster assembly protein [Bacillota bacterium]
MDSNLKRSLLLENFQNPTNRGLIDDKSYIKINTNNESCIDELDIMIKIEDNLIKDMRFDGEACAISTSTASVMIKTLIGKTVDEALNIINNYQNMINEKEYNENIIGEAIIYNEIYKQPNRKKCALLPWDGIKEVLTQYKS